MKTLFPIGNSRKERVKRPSPRTRAYTHVRLVFIAVTRVCLDHRYIILSYMLHSVKYQFREIEELLSHSDD